MLADADHRTGTPKLHKSGQSNLTKRPHRCHTSTVQSHSLGCAHPSPEPNGISIGSAVSAGLAIVTDRPADKQTTLLRCNNRPRLYVSGTAMRTENETAFSNLVASLVVRGKPVIGCTRREYTTPNVFQ